jgi:hypothetical protein
MLKVLQLGNLKSSLKENSNYFLGLKVLKYLNLKGFEFTPQRAVLCEREYLVTEMRYTEALHK